MSSLQDILKARQQEDFVGREEELRFFEENLGRSPEDPRRRFIISVSGQGGVGKTWLLRKFRRLAETTALIAWTDDIQESVPEVMGRIAEQFEAQRHPLRNFAERFKVYRQRKQEIESDPEAPQGVASLVGRTLAKGWSAPGA
jgi:predicted AAA+ superfamily ATPase